MNIYNLVLIFSFIKLIKEINNQYKPYPILICKTPIIYNNFILINFEFFHHIL